MEDSTTPGVDEPTTQPDTTPGETPETTQEKSEKYVPLERFQEVNSNLKATRELAERSEAELTAIKQNLASFGAPKVEETGFDSDTEKQLESWAKSQGFVSQKDMETERAAITVQNDLHDLKAKFELSDAVLIRVREEAAKMGVKDARGLEATYAYLFQDKIIDAKVKAAISGTTASAEKPGGTTSPELPAENGQKEGMSMIERVRAARNK